jgi:CheY-like chemotaxis protein
MFRHILIVDDDPINRLLLIAIMQNWDNTTTSTAKNGAEGIEILKRRIIDLILMDLHMPVMDGFETTIAIRNKVAGLKNSQIPIIAVTSDNMESTRQRLLGIGMNDFMIKPVDHDTLYQKVNKHIIHDYL